MLSRRLRLAAWASLTLLLLVAGGGGASPGSLQKILSSAPAMPGVSTSLLFAPLEGGGGRVAFRPAESLPPASVQKIITAAAALDFYGPDHRFKTRVLAQRPIRSGRLEGNLYLVGEGDPFLVTERLWLLAHEVAVAGVRTVEGSLVVDAETIPFFDEIRRGEEGASPYAAPISRLAVNFNSLTFLIRPAETAGRPAAVWLEPFAIPRLALDAAVRTARAGNPTSIAVKRLQERPTEMWRITGSVALGAPPVRIRRAATDPALLAGGILAGLLGEQGIPIRGIRSGRAPETSVEVAQLESLPLGSLIRSMNVWSNNFMADLLFAGMCEPGQEAAAGARIAAWLAEIVPAGQRATVVDGSGLSPRNRISAEQVVGLLLWAQRQEPIFADLYASLARPGGEGTLERRFRDGAVPALRAKTGTLGDQGVSSIAGYVDVPDGGRYAFCILQRLSPRAGVPLARLRAREEAWLREFVRP